MLKLLCLYSGHARIMYLSKIVTENFYTKVLFSQNFFRDVIFFDRANNLTDFNILTFCEACFCLSLLYSLEARL